MMHDIPGHSTSSDSSKIQSAMHAVYEVANNEEQARNALDWIFSPVESEKDGFIQTAGRLGIDPIQFRQGILDRSQYARNYHYGKPPTCCEQDEMTA